MSELRSTIESLRAEQLGELPDARIEDDFAELQRASETIEVEPRSVYLMAGPARNEWEHSVPKVRHAEPRISITFRHGPR